MSIKIKCSPKSEIKPEFDSPPSISPEKAARTMENSRKNTLTLRTLHFKPPLKGYTQPTSAKKSSQPFLRGLKHHFLHYLYFFYHLTYLGF
jgi:hypothetical protein